MALRTAVKTGLWKEEATWGAAVPTTSDDVVIPSGFTVTIDAIAKCRTIETTGTGKLSVTKALAVGKTGETSFLKFAAGSLSVSGAGAKIEANGTTISITTNGNDLTTLSLAAAATSKYKLLDKLTASTEIILRAGILLGEGQEISTGVIVSEGALAKEFAPGTATIKLSGTNPWKVWLESTTLKVENLTIELTGTTVNLETGGKAVNVVTFTGNELKLVGSNTITTLNLNMTGASRKVVYEEGKTQTITTITKNSGEQKWESTVAGKAWKLIKTSGTLTVEQVLLKDSTAEGGATFIDVKTAGETTDGGNNAGWTFITPGLAMML